MSIILAKILGFYFLALGLGFFINTARFKSIYKQASRDENFLLLGSLIALLIGAVIVSLHNVWVLEWPLIITILGWWSLVKGFAFFTYPNTMKYFSFLEDQPNLFYQIISILYIFLGLFLLYQGYLV